MNNERYVTEDHISDITPTRSQCFVQIKCTLYSSQPIPTIKHENGGWSFLFISHWTSLRKKKESSAWHSVVAILLDFVTIAAHSTVALLPCLADNEVSKRQNTKIAIQEESPWSFWSWETQLLHRNCFFLRVCCDISGGALLQRGEEPRQ